MRDKNIWMHDYFLNFLCFLIRISVHSQPHCKYPAGHSDQLVDSCKYSLRCFHSSSSTLLTSINWALRSGTYTSVRTVNNKKRWNKSSWAQTKLIVFVTNILVIGISDTHSFSKFKQNYVSENPCTRNISAARKLKKYPHSQVQFAEQTHKCFRYKVTQLKTLRSSLFVSQKLQISVCLILPPPRSPSKTEPMAANFREQISW